ncbi:cell envelope integrity protein TolA [Zophobihabitans entericus]|uniref:Cell envelope integrity protein TolA n=1 Tax=Zophobihabitans entericus TaxID=1635327 RepID=A0A6G9IBL9_9GAMM|nr:cell envelope integrity protein TolA [Zophobihabitans entericus]QIQ21628.1 cell envelope integrity protein TolA [Zophobihabitans entericus]
MTRNYNSKLKFAIILSLGLHVAILIALGISAFNYTSTYAGDVNGNAVDAIMVDPRIVSEQYARQVQQKDALVEAEKQRQQQADQRARELEEKQAAEQQRLKDLERERLAALEKQKQEAAAAQAAQAAAREAEAEAAKAKAQLEEQQKQALLAKQKAEEDAKLREQQVKAEQQRIEQEKLRAEAERQKAVEEAEKARQEAERQKQIAAAERAKAEQQKQSAAEEASRQQELNDILGSLTSNAPKVQQGVASGELDKYKTLLHNAISNKFNNSQLYSGKNCVLTIKIARDGLLLSVDSTEGDTALCREAISATKLAAIPKPTSDALYQAVKEVTVDFRP